MGVIFILIKPDGVQTGLAGQIIRRFDRKGFTLKGLKMITVDRPFAEKYYQDWSAKPSFFRFHVDCIVSGPVIAMIWGGENVLLTGRTIIEKTIPTASVSDMDTESGSNLIHVSDSVESAYQEAALWFPDGPVKGPEAATPNARDIGRISFGTMEQTFILIKPDGVQTGLVGKIIRRFDRKGFTLKGLKMITVDRPFAEKHYQDLFAEPFFPHIVDYISSGPVVAMIWEGKNVLSAGRKIVGKTIPCNDMDTDIGSDLIHWSDSVESAYKEIALWFPEGPVKGPDAAKPKQRDIGRISVTGFDTGIPDEDVESALRKHFASCGKITDVYIQKRPCVAYIYFVGEGAVDKALELSGSDVGGWNVCAKACPFRDHESTMLSVEGIDTSLTDSEIDNLSRGHFSSSGEITEVIIFKKRASVVVDIKGFGAVDKALELNGSILGKRKVLVRCLSRPPRYTVHDRVTWLIRRPQNTGFLLLQEHCSLLNWTNEF